MGAFNMREFAPSQTSFEESIKSFTSDTTDTSDTSGSFLFPTSNHVPLDIEAQTSKGIKRSILTFINLDAIKRAAHKEAWGDPTNPFSRGTPTPKKSNTFSGGPIPNDIEATGGLRPMDENVLRRNSSEPMPRSNPNRATEDTISPSTVTGASTWDDKQDPEGSNIYGQHNSSEETSGNRTLTEGPRKRKFFGFLQQDKPQDKMAHVRTGSGTINSKKSTKKFTFRNQMKNTLFNSWINILLLAAPVGIALHFTSVAPAAVFVVNFIAIVPLAALLSYATEEIALRVGETLGGLLNATFGNAVELIVSIIALIKDEIVIVKTSLIGSILSNLLLVMGMCFFFGGLRREEQFFNVTVATTAASLLALAIASIIIPSAFNQFALDNDSTDTAAQKTARTAAISRGTSLILLFVYGCYLFFQLKTHSAIYMQESKKVAMKPRKHKLPEGSVMKGLAAAGGIGAGPGRTHRDSIQPSPDNDELFQHDAFEQQQARDDEEDDEPNLHIWVAVALLAGSTVIIAVCAEFMVGAIGNITGSVSAEFVGLILLPIVGNAAEHATAVTVACKDKMDLAIGVAVGSSMQVSLLVIPAMVILGWILGKDTMNLNFDGFQVAVLFVTVLLVNYLISDGKSNYLEGVLLQCLYLIIAVTAWFYPHTSLTG